MEVAASVVGKAKSVTVIGRSAIPFANLLGEQIGKIIMEVFWNILLFLPLNQILITLFIYII